MLAALINALRVVGKRIEDVKVVTTGCGAAGTAVTKILLAAGARLIIGCDEGGALYKGRPGLNDAKREYAELTNPAGDRGSADEMLAGADVFIGVSVPGAVTPRRASSGWRHDPIVFALANPRSEVEPEEVEQIAAVIATGRSDYPNQINNVLAFPGVFRGALDVRARAITPEMELAAAHAIAAGDPRGRARVRLHRPQRLRPERRSQRRACGRSRRSHRGCCPRQAGGAAMTVTYTELGTGTVGEAMNPGVLTCLPVTPLRTVARMMARHRVHAIVVFGTDDRLHPWGVISDLDLVEAIGTHANAGTVAASPVVTVTPELTLLHAAKLLAENETSHLLVINDAGLPIGVLSTLDIARAFAAEAGLDENGDV